MSLPIPSALWQELCALQARYPLCIITLYKHGQVISKADVLITLRAGAEALAEPNGTGSDATPYGLNIVLP